MAYKSFRSVEKQAILTTPNLMTAARAVGGVVLGISMMRSNPNYTVDTAAALLLGASDAEGILIAQTKRFPRVQKALRIIPSAFGRITDPIADKIFTVSLLAGGLVSGVIPLEQGIGIGLTEVATIGATAYATANGEIPEVSKAGKMGMVSRCATIGFDLGSAASDGGFHEAFMYSGYATAAASVVLGAISCRNILNQVNASPQMHVPDAV